MERGREGRKEGGKKNQTRENRNKTENKHNLRKIVINIFRKTTEATTSINQE